MRIFKRPLALKPEKDKLNVNVAPHDKISADAHDSTPVPTYSH